MSGVRLAKMSKENVGYAPDGSFPNEILVSGNLEVAPVTPAKATRISAMTDLIGPIGLVEGESLSIYSVSGHFRGVIFLIQGSCISRSDAAPRKSLSVQLSIEVSLPTTESTEPASSSRHRLVLHC